MHQPLVPIPYAVIRRGRQLGFTDLTWTRYDESQRAGWFYPDSEAGVDEALDPENALDLELRRGDGSLVPTEWIGIQDTERLIALAHDEMDGWDADVDQDMRILEASWADEAEWSLHADGADWDFDDGDWEADDEFADWTPDDDEVDMPRYQILVRLAVPNAIP